jgi:hypothetical protein
MSRRLAPGHSGPLFTLDDLRHLLISIATGLITMAVMHELFPRAQADILTFMGGWVAQLPLFHLTMRSPLEDLIFDDPRF